MQLRGPCCPITVLWYRYAQCQSSFTTNSVLHLNYNIFHVFFHLYQRKLLVYQRGKIALLPIKMFGVKEWSNEIVPALFGAFTLGIWKMGSQGRELFSILNCLWWKVVQWPGCLRWTLGLTRSLHCKTSQNLLRTVNYETPREYVASPKLLWQKHFLFMKHLSGDECSVEHHWGMSWNTSNSYVRSNWELSHLL